MSRVIPDEPEVRRFGAARLTHEIVRADTIIAQLDDGTAPHTLRRWRWYRERLVDWRYCAVRDITVPRLVACPRCLRLFTPRRHLAFHAKCWCCGRPWMFS